MASQPKGASFFLNEVVQTYKNFKVKKDTRKTVIITAVSLEETDISKSHSEEASSSHDDHDEDRKSKITI